MSQEQDQILRMVEEGQISATEANELLQAIDEAEVEPVPASSSPSPELAPVDRRPGAWQIPTAAGAVLAFLGFAGSLRNRQGAGRVASGLALLAGVAVVFIGLWSRTALWLHIRVQEQDGDRVRISFPLPLGLADWALRTARQVTDDDNMAEQIEMASAFLEAVRHGEREPFLIEVDDEDGDQVVIYLG